MDRIHNSTHNLDVFSAYNTQPITEWFGSVSVSNTSAYIVRVSWSRMQSCLFGISTKKWAHCMWRQWWSGMKRGASNRVTHKGDEWERFITMKKKVAHKWTISHVLYIVCYILVDRSPWIFPFILPQCCCCFLLHFSTVSAFHLIQIYINVKHTHTHAILANFI